jgi:hypothetical protein
MMIHHITMAGAGMGVGMSGEGMVDGASMEDGKCTSIKKNNVVMGW